MTSVTPDIKTAQLSEARHLSLLVPCEMADPLKVGQSLLRLVSLSKTELFKTCDDEHSNRERRLYVRESIVMLLSGVFGVPGDEALEMAETWAEGVLALELVENEPPCPN